MYYACSAAAVRQSLKRNFYRPRAPRDTRTFFPQPSEGNEGRERERNISGLCGFKLFAARVIFPRRAAGARVTRINLVLVLRFSAAGSLISRRSFEGATGVTCSGNILIGVRADGGVNVSGR